VSKNLSDVSASTSSAISLPKKKVLFVCMGNACRSPMAESIARRDAADILEVTSAGISPLGFLPELTQKTLTGNECSIELLSSKAITRELWDSADIVINMSGMDRYRAFPQPGKVEDWQVQDPYGADPELYQKIYEDIRERVGKLADRLRKSAQSSSGKHSPSKQPVGGAKK
jgi:arsenate reductase (thioredoxin)